MEDSIAKMKSILAMDSELNQIQDLDILLERVLQQARRVTSADAGSIYIKNAEQLRISFSQNETLQNALPEGRKLIYNIFSIPVSTKTISGYVASTSEILNIPDGIPFRRALHTVLIQSMTDCPDIKHNQTLPYL